ncbi:MAG: selenide, water dikinase SelD [Actinomycetota bacterium]
MDRLTSYSHGAGCACKLGPGELAQVLRRLRDQPATRHPYLLVGIDGSDDAGVFRLSDDLALVQTVDFFTPIVDEADDWGRIAAVNALSDVYAMGGTPLTALLIVGWPRETLSFDLLGDVLAGAAEILAGAGVTIVGGHSVDDPEPKFGLAVTGTIHPDRVLRNQGARPGDLLVLTKPIGTGVIATGIKRGVVSQEIRDAAVLSMTALNDTAGRVAVEAGAAAATDVTGFGLLGHLGEMLGAVGAEVDAASVPLLAGARELASDGVIPGGSRRNLEHASGFTEFGDLDATTRILLADAQTSGGLLVAIDEDRIGVLLSGLTRGAVFPAVIGRFTEEHAGRVMVT